MTEDTIIDRQSSIEDPAQPQPGTGTIEQAMEPEEYAIVEIFGHRRHVGRVMEVDRFGAKLLRIDVPTEGDFAKGFVSHFYGGSSIFSFTNTDLETVKRVNARRETAPGVYTPRLTYSDDDDFGSGEDD